MKLYKIFTILSLSFVILSIAGCKKDLLTIEELDDQNIKAYIQQNNLDVQQYNNTGIYYKILTPGTGPAIRADQHVALVYTMRSMDGKYSGIDTLFGNRYANYAGYISPEGMRVGISEILKKTNGEIRLLIPSRLAFGRNGDGKIHGNASIDFSVKVIDKASLPAYDDSTIKHFLQTNNLTGFTKLPSGVYYKIIDPGIGTAPITEESQILVVYSGKLLDGRLFDDSIGSTFYLQNLIPGWRETLPLITEGGSIRIIIPSSSAYGFGSSGLIPPFSCLDFEITVKNHIP